jgi:membrane fusion protein (multidrug efflux system)
MLGAGAAGAYWKFVMEPERQAAAGGPVPGGGRGGGTRGPTPVEAAEVRIGPVEVTTEAVGSLLSNESVVIRPEVTGRVAAINFDEGAPVKAGQVIVELDASVERAQLAQAEAELSLGTANFERAKELRRSNVGTQRALDEAQAQLRTAEAAIQLAKARLSKLTLTAPFDAVAGLRRVSVGDFVTAGTDIVGLEQIKPLKVDFAIPEIFLRSVREGQRIAFTVDAFPGEAFEGEVFAVSPLVSEAGRAVRLRARIDNTDVRLRPGLFARVTLTLSQQPDGVWIGEEAVVPEGGRQFVFKVANGGEGKPNVARKTEVKLGLRRQGEVQVASGLAPGDVVVTGGVSKIREDAPVAVQQAPGGAPQAAPATAAGPAPGTPREG